MIELERTFLAKNIPTDLDLANFKEIIDIYIPKKSQHPKLRLRKNGNNYEFTKKEPIALNDASNQKEETIVLNKSEFEVLKKIEGRRVRKHRYYYKFNNYLAEIDFFQDELLGLVVVDFEFETVSEKDSFVPPDFCLIDITQEEFIAGGVISGKSYIDIEMILNKFNYRKLFLT